ncbi:MAG: ACT domain-containing protein [Coriobacteriia bacterium]|nr:ACT domain-containing protein [Coriobacteriia bacterium]
MIEQLSVFLENEQGRLARMCRVLGDGGFNMHALVVADTSDYGVARVICDRPHGARHALENEGFAVSLTRVIAVEIPDTPGGLASLLETLGDEGVNVEYLYCYVRPDAAAAVDIFRVEDPGRAAAVLDAAGITLVGAERVYEPDAL